MVRAVHHVRRKTGREVVVESELGLVASGQSPWVWRVPVSGAREIETSLDGVKTSLSIAAGGQVGEVAIAKAGDHILTVRRSFGTRSEDGFEVLSFPVNPIAAALVLVDAPEAGKVAPAIDAVGGTRIRSDGSEVGRLGPAEKVDVRWADSRAGLEQKQGVLSVEGLVLWDINPAGDRVRTRLVYQSPRELGSLRLSHPGGLILRGARVLGSAGYVWCENAAKEEWVLHVDPPLEAGGTIEIDSWMPSAIMGGRAGWSAVMSLHVPVSVRQLPVIQPIAPSGIADLWELAGLATGRAALIQRWEASQ